MYSAFFIKYLSPIFIILTFLICPNIYKCLRPESGISVKSSLSELKIYGILTFKIELGILVHS